MTLEELKAVLRDRQKLTEENLMKSTGTTSAAWNHGYSEALRFVLENLERVTE